jgi:hypothetical protein
MSEKQKSEAKKTEKGKIEEITAFFATLPRNEKGSRDTVTVSEIFSSVNDDIFNNFMEGFEALLYQKGYGYSELAQYLLEKTGIQITAKQLKFHHLRGKALREKAAFGSDDSHMTEAPVKERIRSSSKLGRDKNISSSESAAKKDPKLVASSDVTSEIKNTVIDDNNLDTNTTIGGNKLTSSDSDVAIPTSTLPLLDSDEYPNYEENDDEQNISADASGLKVEPEQSEKSAESQGDRKNRGSDKVSTGSKEKETPASRKTFGSNKPGSFVIDMENRPV